ncbi:MAG TPA: SpoIID/LytB domain-containing protein [Acidimicrobiales bacterium]|nr:SpoIID/LytB domain-containing protein [Acidimicrobiales bacterium]
MNRSRRRLATLLCCTSLLAAGLVAGGVASAPSAGAYPSAQIDLVRRGLGHGRGMSQWGALGYAVGQGWSHAEILAYYYGGTAPGTIGNDTVTVQLTKFNDRDTLVQQERGQAVVEGVVGQHAAVRVRRGAAGIFEVDTGPSCAGPWTLAATQPSVRISPAAGLTDDRTGMLQVCESSPIQNRWVRGNVLAVNAAGAAGAADRITMNELPMESYLKGVVPRESPASWGNLGGGRGQQALMAQAVAARSYAQASDVAGPAKTCDTTTCQVYGGRALENSGGFTDLEAANTNRAVDETAGQVRRNSSGAVDRTEFSASTGGWTARVEDGNKYGAVEDVGDGYCTAEVCNPLHESNVTVAVSVLENRYGLGTLERIDVLARNGLGADGGRVTRLRFVFSGGERTFEGEEQVRSAMGIGSSWFRVTNPPASFPYHVVTRDGGVFSFGGAQFHGSLPGIGVRTPAKDITEGPGGYWILGEDGGVFSFDVPFYGSMGGQRLNSPVVGMQSTAARQGYWLVAGDGGIFTFGDAPFFGSTGDLRLNRPVVAMAPTGSGQGYWMVATDGGIFTFGDAPFLGSTGDLRLNQPVFAMAPTPSGNGYWLVARDGGIFTFGDAGFQGSLPGRNIGETAVELLPSPSGKGYLIVTAQGRVHAFGDAVSGGGPADVGAGPSPAVGAGRVA